MIDIHIPHRPSMSVYSSHVKFELTCSKFVWQQNWERFEGVHYHVMDAAHIVSALHPRLQYARVLSMLNFSTKPVHDCWISSMVYNGIASYWVARMTQHLLVRVRMMGHFVLPASDLDVNTGLSSNAPDCGRKWDCHSYDGLSKVSFVFPRENWKYTSVRCKPALRPAGCLFRKQALLMCILIYVV